MRLFIINQTGTAAAASFNQAAMSQCSTKESAPSYWSQSESLHGDQFHSAISFAGHF